MPFCPKCRYEYNPEVKECPDCGEKLVASLGPDPNQGELFDTVVLYKVPDEITGLALRSFLLDAGIEAVLQDMQASFYGSVLTGMQGYWGKVIVAKEQESRARELLAEFKQDFPGD
jgi:hypothetical protein